MKKIITVLILGAVAFLGVRMAIAPTDYTFEQTASLPQFPDLALPTVSEKVAVAVDGEVAYKNSDEIQPTASTAKMISAIMVMEKKPFALGETGETIEITKEFYDKYLYYARNNGSNTVVQVGEKISEYDGLASALLPSSNNMADTLAIWAFGSLENYKEYTTKRLAEWGLHDTIIGIDASGFSDTTKSSAADLAIVAQKLMENPVLADIVGKKSHQVPVAGTIENTNKTLGELGIIGVKTGHISKESGYCLATAYKLGEHLVTVVVLKSPTREDSFAVSKQVIEAMQKSLTGETALVRKGQEVGYYESWWGGRTPIVADEDAAALSWAGAEASVKLGETLDYKIGNKNISVPVSAEGFRNEPSFWDRLQFALFLK